MRANLTDLYSLGLLAFSGKDAKTFLQGQVTCDLNKVTPENSSLGAHCNLKGRMQSCFRLWMMADPEPIYYLILPRSMIPSTQQDLKKYAMFSKVVIQDHSNEWDILGLMGDPATDLIAQIFDIPNFDLPVNGTKTLPSPEGSMTFCHVQDQTIRYEMYVKKNAFMSQIQQLKDQCDRHVNWELADIEAGLPMVYPQTIDKLIPNHVNLVQLEGISFDKGCYLGQEIVARLQWRGKMKKHMVMVEVPPTANPPQAGDPYEGKGIVVRAALKEGGGYLMLVVLDVEALPSPALRAPSP